MPRTLVRPCQESRWISPELPGWATWPRVLTDHVLFKVDLSPPRLAPHESLLCDMLLPCLVP